MAGFPTARESLAAFDDRGAIARHRNSLAGLDGELRVHSLVRSGDRLDSGWDEHHPCIHLVSGESQATTLLLLCERGVLIF